MIFENRYDAAMQLIPLLKKYKKENVLVLAIPRGGVPLGYHIAKEYDWPLDLLLTKKIGHPANKEFAIGSVSLEGEVINPVFAGNEEYINAEIIRIRESLKERYKLFMGNRKPEDMKGKTVIIVDDGIATGNTMLASIETVRLHQPKQVVIAIPVIPPDTFSRLEEKTDDVICLLTPENFRAVGQFYRDFSQVSDEEVLELIEEIRKDKK